MFAPAARIAAVPRRCNDAPGVTLTFDDGPHQQGTPAVLRILGENGVRAMFFLAGEQVERRPSLAAEITAAGHQLGVHCRRHRNLLALTRAQVREDLDRAMEAIGGATGRAVAFHRPPYGIYSWQALSDVRRRGWQPLLWSRWGRDWAGNATAQGIADRATRAVSRGDVILLHDSDAYSTDGSWQRTVQALPRIIDALGARNLLDQSRRGA